MQQCHKATAKNVTFGQKKSLKVFVYNASVLLDYRIINVGSENHKHRTQKGL